MALREVQPKTNQNSGASSVLTSTVVGGLSGYALKWAIPLNSYEKDDEFSLECKKNEKRVKEVRQAEIELIKKSKLNVAARDEFISSLSEKEPINALSVDANEIKAQLNSVIESAKAGFHEDLITKIKSKRPAETFVLLGAITGLAAGLICKAFKSDNNKS